MKMKNFFQRLTLFSFCLMLLFTVNLSYATAGEYQKLHKDIQIAMAEENVKKAKTIVKELLPILEEDIAYTQLVISEEEDEYFLGQLSQKYRRQKEIKQKLEEFIKTKKVNDDLSSESMNMVRELRRLSSKPRER